VLLRSKSPTSPVRDELISRPRRFLAFTYIIHESRGGQGEPKREGGEREKGGRDTYGTGGPDQPELDAIVRFYRIVVKVAKVARFDDVLAVRGGGRGRGRGWWDAGLGSTVCGRR
jgi:hypothetical protein